MTPVEISADCTYGQVITKMINASSLFRKGFAVLIIKMINPVVMPKHEIKKISVSVNCSTMETLF